MLRVFWLPTPKRSAPSHSCFGSLERITTAPATAFCPRTWLCGPRSTSTCCMSHSDCVPKAYSLYVAERPSMERFRRGRVPAKNATAPTAGPEPSTPRTVGKSLPLPKSTVFTVCFSKSVAESACPLGSISGALNTRLEVEASKRLRRMRSPVTVTVSNSCVCTALSDDACGAEAASSAQANGAANAAATRMAMVLGCGRSILCLVFMVFCKDAF